MFLQCCPVGPGYNPKTMPWLGDVEDKSALGGGRELYHTLYRLKESAARNKEKLRRSAGGGRGGGGEGEDDEAEVGGGSVQNNSSTDELSGDSDAESERVLRSERYSEEQGDPELVEVCA